MSNMWLSLTIVEPGLSSKGSSVILEWSLSSLLLELSINECMSLS